MVLVSFDLFLLIRMNAFQEAFDGFRAAPSNNLAGADPVQWRYVVSQAEEGCGGGVESCLAACGGGVDSF